LRTHSLEAYIDINADAQRVWNILTDFVAYPQWNPFIKYLRGDLRQGSKLLVRIEPRGAKGMTFEPTVLLVEPCRELRWIGHVWMPGIFDGEHCFRIERRAHGASRFHQAEQFRGILVPLLRARLDRKTKSGFEEMNAALKVRAEA